MKTAFFTLLIAASFSSSACRHKHREIVVDDVESVRVDEEHSIAEEPPPTDIPCADTLSLKDLFLMLCNKVKPVNADSTAKYHLVLYRIKDCMAVRFVSDKEYTSTDTLSSNLANKRKSFPFYPLSMAGYHNQEWHQIFTKIRTGLKTISQTSEFKNSNLARAKSVTVQLNDLEEVVLK